MGSKPRVFISHAHKDQGHCDELLIRLAPLQGQGLIDDIWHPGKIQAGLDKARERDDALARAHVVLTELREHPERNRLVLAHGHSDQCVHWFVRRIEEYIAAKLGCRQITVAKAIDNHILGYLPAS